MFHRPARRALTAVSVALIGALALAGCNAAKDVPVVKGKPSSSPSPTVSTAKITSNVRPNANAVKMTKHIQVHVIGGQLQNVTLTGPGGVVPGKLADDQRSWRATGLLKPATKYVVHGVAVDDQGLRKQYTNHFRTQKLTLDQQTYPSFVPTDGSTVGVGMPVIIRFDVPVTDKKAIQSHLQVTPSPAQPGSFHWISDNEVHWRPQHYWRAGSTVHVKANIGGVPAGNGIFGQLDRQMTFHVGRAMVSRVNIQTDHMQVFRNGQLIKTIPITTGKPGFTTRSGTKVIVEKFRHKRMNSETIGIDPNSANGYDLNDVEYAMRITFSGEFLHAAPWSVGQQGHSNVSHGCTGMSTPNAAWLYNNSIIGDVVEYTGSQKYMTLTNGYGDWNESFAQYRQGSAL